MSRPQPPDPAKLVIGFFCAQRDLAAPVAAALVEAFGPLDLVSPWLAFDYTAYYAAEMGAALFRRVLAFKALVAQERLAEVKLATNAIEQRFSVEGRRRVNIDPGYLLRERFVLATGKNFSHRIYVGQGIYADLTLVYTRGRFQALPWTYPDYAAADLQAFLSSVRDKYVADLKATRGAAVLADGDAAAKE